MAQFVVGVIVGHLAKLGNTLLQLTHGRPHWDYFSVGLLLDFCSKEMSGSDTFAVFLLMRSVACNSMVNLPGRFRATPKGCGGRRPALSGTSSLMSSVFGFDTGAPLSSRIRISTTMLGCFFTESRSKPTTAQ